MKNPMLLPLVAALLTPLASAGETPSIPNNFTAGTPAVANDVNANFQALADAIGEIPQASNTVSVAKSGADYTTITEALASITDASGDNRYVVNVAPGTFEEADFVTVPAFVHLRGSGQGITTVRVLGGSNQTTPAASAVLLEDLGAISALRIENDAASGIAIGLFVSAASRQTIIRNVTVDAQVGTGTGATGIQMVDSDAVVLNCRATASGGTIVNTGLTSNDTSGAFAQPLLINCFFTGTGQGTGNGAFLLRTAATFTNCTIVGNERGIFAGIGGISQVRDSRVETIGLLPCYEATGSATILSAGTMFVAGNPIGLSSAFKYVWCYKANYNAVVNGLGSSVQ